MVYDAITSLTSYLVVDGSIFDWLLSLASFPVGGW